MEKPRPLLPLLALVLAGTPLAGGPAHAQSVVAPVLTGTVPAADPAKPLDPAEAKEKVERPDPGKPAVRVEADVAPPPRPRPRHVAPPLSIVIADTGPFAARAPAPVTEATPARPSLFQAAPLPNPDLTAPLGAGPSGPELSPAFFSRKTEFSGDGFAAGSSLEESSKYKRKAAAGLNWSVPVK